MRLLTAVPALFAVFVGTSLSRECGRRGEIVLETVGPLESPPRFISPSHRYPVWAYLIGAPAVTESASVAYMEANQ